MINLSQQEKSLQIETETDQIQSPNDPAEFNKPHNFYEQMSDQFISDQIEHQLSIQSNNDNKVNYGSMITLIKNADNTPKFMLGPHYFMFIPTIILSSWFLIYSIQTFHQKLHFGTVPLIICTITALLFIISFLLVGISNPGIASTIILPTLQQRLDSRYCRDCKVLKVNRTRHCQFCNVCILQMDHHCIWVGKCIGKNNMKYFKLFIFSTLATLVVFSVCIFVSSQYKPMKVK